MERMHIDIETYSDRDLAKCGVYAYTESKAFEVLLFGVSVDGGPVQCYDLKRGEKLPKEITEGLKNERVLKYAFNAAFERRCLSRYLGCYLDPHGWRCTMVHALTLGLPGSLQGVGEVLKLRHKKLQEGGDLIRVFSVPGATGREKPDGRRASEDAAGRQRPSGRTLPEDLPEEWERFKRYNIRDVEAEMEIEEKLSAFPVPECIWKEYCLDQYCNDLGVRIDRKLVEEAIRCDGRYREEYLQRARELTGLENPNSPEQLKAWLNEQGVALESVTKAEVAAALEQAKGKTREVLELRQLLSKSSVKKYQAMMDCMAEDGRAHGLLQFYGAARTGRWAGRLIQVQNLPQTHLKDLEGARALLRAGEQEKLALLYDPAPETLSQLIRTAFVPAEGMKLTVLDFSQVEARTLSWLAGERWRMEMFKRGDDLYCASASRMFHVPVQKDGVNGHLRQRGKIAELALGYGGGVNAMIAMGATRLGLPEKELQGIVNAWREANPRIAALWWEIDRVAKQCVRERRETTCGRLGFQYERGFLFIRLPSGRRLAYPKAQLTQNERGQEELSYMGTGTDKHWQRIQSYGPKLTENIIQAISRDLFAEAMGRLDDAGYSTVMHVHDEVVLEVTKDRDMEEARAIMTRTPEWAEGLILNASGFESEYYRKD